MSSLRDSLTDGVLGAVLGDLHLGARFVLLSVASWMAVTLIVSWWRRCVRFRRLELSIAGPKSLPLVGNALSMVGINKDNILDIMLEFWGGRYSELSRMSLFNNLIVIVTDANNIQQLLSDRRFLEKPDFFYKNLAMFTGQGLVTANVELWKAHRTAVTPTFNAKVFEGFLDIFSAEAKNFVERMRPALGRDAEFTQDLSYTAAMAIIHTALPLTEEDKAKVNLPRALQIVSHRTFKPWLWPSAIFNLTPTGREMDKIRRNMYGMVEDKCHRRTEEISAKAAEDKLEGRRQGRKCFVDLMLEAKLAQRTDYTNGQIVEEVVTVFGAAVETIVTSLTFTFKLLSVLPDVQRRVHDEILDVLGNGDRPITSEGLARLEYTERVIKESMRIFPAVPFIARHVPVDIQLGGKTIPGGSVLAVNIYGAHRDPQYYPDPLRFDPDRFLPERVAERPPGSYVPFSAGPRNCIGKSYAMMQMKIILATTLRAYKLLPADDGYTHPSQFPLTWDLTLVFVGGAKIRFEPRG